MRFEARARARAHGNVLQMSSRDFSKSFFVLREPLESSKCPPMPCPRPLVLWKKSRPRQSPLANGSSKTSSVSSSVLWLRGQVLHIAGLRPPPLEGLESVPCPLKRPMSSNVLLVEMPEKRPLTSAIRFAPSSWGLHGHWKHVL